MSNTETNNNNNICRVCRKKPPTKKLTVFLCDDDFTKGYTGLVELVRRLRNELEAANTNTNTATATTTPQVEEEPTINNIVGMGVLPAEDRYKIKKIYPDSETPQMIYMNMDNPSSDPLFRNEDNANMTRGIAGGWVQDGSDNGKYQVRLELWQDNPIRDCEITVYAKWLADIASIVDSAYAYQVYRGGGHHTTNLEGQEGAAYKGRIKRDRSVVIAKEIRHADYTSNQGGIMKLEKDPYNNFIGVKLVVYNLTSPVNGRIPVKIEVWCDEYGMTPDGKLDPTKQNWKKYAEYTDKGGWSSGTGGGNPGLELGNTGLRKPDEIFNTPFGAKQNKGNLGAYRTDGAKTEIKYFSFRKIKSLESSSPPAPTVTPPTTTAPTTTQQQQDTPEHIFHGLLNEYRKQQGLTELQYDDALADLAKKHTLDMSDAGRHYYDEPDRVNPQYAKLYPNPYPDTHTNPDGKDPFKRADEAGYRWSTYCENICRFQRSDLAKWTNQQIAEQVFSQWLNSKKGHRENMLNSRVDREGVGIYVHGDSGWATEDLAKKR